MTITTITQNKQTYSLSKIRRHMLDKSFEEYCQQNYLSPMSKTHCYLYEEIYQQHQAAIDAKEKELTEAGNTFTSGNSREDLDSLFKFMEQLARRGQKHLPNHPKSFQAWKLYKYGRAKLRTTKAERDKAAAAAAKASLAAITVQTGQPTCSLNLPPEWVEKKLLKLAMKKFGVSEAKARENLKHINPDSLFDEAIDCSCHSH